VNRRSFTNGRISVVALVALLISASLAAHEVPVEQLVELTMRIEGNRLRVELHVPATALPDAKLPRQPDGSLDAAAIEQPLQVVAAATARSLDVQQYDESVAPLASSARLAADRKSVDIELGYAISGGHGLSARLNAFESAPLQPVRTNARFIPSSGSPQQLSVVGPAVRVPFDPGAIDTVREFAARSLASMLTFGDHLLMLVCLVLPHRRVGRAARLLAALVAGQALTIAAGAAVPQQVGALAPAGAFVAASVVVVAAAQNIVDARFSWTAALAFAFGVLNGVTLGADFASASQLAGAHRGVALATVLLVVAAAQLWLGAVLWATRAWLATKRVPEQIGRAHV